MTKQKNSQVSTDSFPLCVCMCVSRVCCQVYAVMETTSNPWSVAKPETFQSLSLTTGLDYRLFNSPSALSVWRSRPLGHSNHGEHPERLPSGGVVKAAGKRSTRGSVSVGSACVRSRMCPRDVDDMHTQTDRLQVLLRSVHVSVLSDTLMTDRTQTDRGWSSLRKQIKTPIFTQTRGTSCVNPTKTDMLWSWKRQINDGQILTDVKLLSRVTKINVVGRDEGGEGVDSRREGRPENIRACLCKCVCPQVMLTIAILQTTEQPQSRCNLISVKI